MRKHDKVVCEYAPLTTAGIAGTADPFSTEAPTVTLIANDVTSADESERLLTTAAAAAEDNRGRQKIKQDCRTKTTQASEVIKTKREPQASEQLDQRCCRVSIHGPTQQRAVHHGPRHKHGLQHRDGPPRTQRTQRQQPCPSHRGPRVVYYQNRFISVPSSSCTLSVTPIASPSGASNEPGTHHNTLEDGSDSSNMAVQGMSAVDIDRALGIIDMGSTDDKGTTSKGSTSKSNSAPPKIKVDTVKSKAKPEPEPSTSNESRLKSLALTGPAKVLRKVARVLRDNRTQSGGKINKKMAAKVKKMNQEDLASQTILKKILNIIFVTTGMSLFISVVIVIIYTSIVPTCPPLICPPTNEGTPGSTPEDLMRLREQEEAERIRVEKMNSLLNTILPRTDFSTSWVEDSWGTTESSLLDDEPFDFNVIEFDLQTEVPYHNDLSKVHRRRHSRHKQQKRHQLPIT